MTTAFRESFERAYESKLEELGIDDTQADVDPADLGRTVALLVAARTRWEQQLGPLLSSTDFQRLSGLSRQALAQAVTADRVVRLTTGRGRTCYPAFQLDAGGRLRPWLRPVVSELSGAGLSAWAVASWLTSPQPELEDRSPIGFVDSGGGVEEVATLARRRAARLAR